MDQEERMRDAYLDWLCCIAEDPGLPRKKSHTKLLTRLFYAEFIYDNDMDANRANNGKRLRYDFLNENGCSNYIGFMSNYPCSVLEVIISLALYIEQEIMSNPYYGDRTRTWIWKMITNLELDSQTDDRYFEAYVNSRIKIFLNKEYCLNGQGGLFVSGTCRCMPSKDIWSQACIMLNEILQNEEGIYYGKSR